MNGKLRIQPNFEGPPPSLSLSFAIDVTATFSSVASESPTEDPAALELLMENIMAPNTIVSTLTLDCWR
jgi:hypothetical protein